MWVPRLAPFSVASDSRRVVLGIDEWRLVNGCVWFRGWLASKDEPTGGITVQVGQSVVEVSSWHERPDVAAKYPDFDGFCRGFVVGVPCETHLFATVKFGDIGLGAYLKAEPIESMSAEERLYPKFAELVGGKRVVELGARTLDPRTRWHRDDFAEHIGFDLYSGPGVDVVGDVHRLKECLEAAGVGVPVDGIYSRGTMEHVSMPWVAAREMAACLPVGGAVYHVTHFAWPLHEEPWDFWRFTSHSFWPLFGPLGFKLIDSVYTSPVRIEWQVVEEGNDLAVFNVQYGKVEWLGYKEREVSLSRFRWDVDLMEASPPGTSYPFKERW